VTGLASRNVRKWQFYRPGVPTVGPTVYEKFADNDYVMHSCGCGNLGVPTLLWTDTYVERLGKHARCKLLQTGWCPTHGDDFCAAILDGECNRDDVTRPEAA
jgi:hypothetical protein